MPKVEPWLYPCSVNFTVNQFVDVQKFKYNTLETLYLVTAMFILLSGT